MSFLQKGHVEKSFYERSSQSYLDTTNTSFLTRAANNAFLDSTNSSFLSTSSDSFLANNTNKSYLNHSNSSFLSVDTTASHIDATNKSYIENSSTSYLSSVKPSVKNSFLQEDHQKHVTEINAAHLDEDRNNHLEESGGETSDEDAEDFSHAVDWSLIVPPHISPIFRNGATHYKCALSNRIHNEMPAIPERFDVFDFDIQQLIETISRFQMKDGIQKYRELMARKKDLHSTELQSQALEALRVWKHKKEQELLGQVNIQSADYSDRTERMGVGDTSSGGAAERKRKREALKRKQQGERQKQLALKQRLKQEQNLKSQEEIVKRQRNTAQRQKAQQQATQRKMQQQRREDAQKQKLREQQAADRHHYVTVESKNIARERMQQNAAAMNRNMSDKKNEDKWRQEQRMRDQEEKQNYVKVEQKNISAQRQQNLYSNMQSELDQKMDSQSSFRANIEAQRSNRTQQQQEAQREAARAKKAKQAQLDAEARRKEEERLEKAAIKDFVSKINNLLDVKSSGIDFDDFGNEFYFKYKAQWNPEGIMGTSDLEQVFKLHGLRSTVEVIRGGMTKRAILFKHYQKIKIISGDKNDILTVLAISDSIDIAIGRLRQMMNQREEKKKNAAQQKRMAAARKPAARTATAGGGRQTDYSQSNNWGLPRGTRARKTPQGRIFYVNDNTKTTTWVDPRPLPRGWRSGATNTGKKFYINDATKTTSWSDPRPAIRI